MKLSVRVQHHPAREHLLTDLLFDLGDFDDLAVVADPGGEQPSSWRSHRACLASVTAGATHLLVVQDDAMPCWYFHDRATRAIEGMAGDVLALFVPGFPTHVRALARAAQLGRRYTVIPTYGFVPLVATVYTARGAADLLSWAEEDAVADDAVVARWARAQGVRVTATVPCLVEHDDEQPSLFDGKAAGTGDPRRRAALYDC